MQILIFIFFLYFASLHISVAAMETLGSLLYVSSLIVSIKNKQFIWPSKFLLLIFTSLLISASVTALSNSYSAKSYLNLIGEFRWMLSFVGFLQFHQLCFRRIDFQKLLLTGQSLLLIAGFYSIYQFFTAHDFFRKNVVFHYIYQGSPYSRPNSFFGLPTTYAYASAMFFCISLAFWMREKRPTEKWRRFLSQFYFVMSSFNIFLTFTRAAWVAFITSTLGVLQLTNKKMMIRVSLTFLILISAFYSSVPSFRNRLNSMYDPSYVANHNRIYLWQANLMIFKDHPLFGAGFDDDRKIIDSYLNQLDKPEVMRNHPHNTYINFLSGLGIFGFSIFMLFIFNNLKTAWMGLQKSQSHYYKTIYIGALGLQLVLLIGGLTECTFEDIELTHQYILFTSLIEYLRQQELMA